MLLYIKIEFIINFLNQFITFQVAQPNIASPGMLFNFVNSTHEGVLLFSEF